MKKLLDFLASYGLCCILLICLFCLTLFGTLYQVDHGLYEAKAVYFGSWYLYTKEGFVLPFPGFPGGMTCMLLLTVNMFLGGLIRIKISKRNFGVVIIHIGIAFLLASGLVKMATAEEGNLKLVEGQKSRFFESYNNWEVALWPLGKAGEIDEYIIRHDQLSDLTGTLARSFHAEGLPFELTLTNFVKNCQVQPKGPMWQSTGPVVDGYGILAQKPDKQAEFNVAGMHAKVGDKTAILWGMESQPWTVELPNGERWAVAMRHESYEMPFEIKLIDFIKEDHPGLSMARAFRSRVIKIDENGEQPVLIQMNEPLRKNNLVLFQSSYGNTRRGDEYSVFSVVRNVSDKWPEYSLYVITLGMLITFVRKLLGFVKSTNKKRTAAAGAA